MSLVPSGWNLITQEGEPVCLLKATLDHVDVSYIAVPVLFDTAMC